jgi:hypothetical protein
MKIILKKIKEGFTGLKPSMIIRTIFIVLFSFFAFSIFSQESAEAEKDTRPVRSMFESTWLIDNQSVIVPIKGTFQMDILHRFGVVKNGYDDLYGLFAPSNIKLGFAYTVIDNLSLGIGLTKTNMTVDFNIKYAILQQTRSGTMPISLTYFGNAAIDSRNGDNFINSSDRFSYFHQLIIARKVSDKLSLQVAPSISHYNAVEAYLDPDKEIIGLMNNDHIAVAFSGRFKIKDQMAIIANYDQPISEHLSNNPNPNLSFGIEMFTSSHTFQVFISNYQNIIPQRNNVFNNNNFEDGEYLIGFNMTRLWN